MAVKSANISASRSLRREKDILDMFKGCPDHIIRCFGSDITIENGLPFYNILLEYAGGGSLAAHLRSAGGGGGLPESEARQHAKSVLMGLKYIHDRGYIHCDIKPHNILIVTEKTGERKTKIADFGLAMAGGKGRIKKKMRGTLMYMAPESIGHGEYGTWADIWGFGCTLLELMTGKRPWIVLGSNIRLEEMLKLIIFSDKTPRIPSTLSREARDFLRRCLDRDPKSRWSADMLLSHPFIQQSATATITSAIIPCGSLQAVTSKLGKRKRNMEEEEEEEEEEDDDDQEEEQLRASSSILLDGLGEYWGIKRRISSVMPRSSSTSSAIQIFN